MSGDQKTFLALLDFWGDFDCLFTEPDCLRTVAQREAVAWKAYHLWEKTRKELEADA